MESGLEFASEPGVKDPLPASGTVTREIIDSLFRLNWDANGKLYLFGCNTAVMRGGTDWTVHPSDSWAPASEFANIQGVETQGEDDFASFSEDNNKYVKISGHSNRIYLEAFRKLKIGIVIGTGTRKPPIIFEPSSAH